VDDILILCNEEMIDSVFKEIEIDLTNKNLDVHDLEKGSNKTDFGKLDDGFNFLGYLYKDNILTVRKSSIEKLENSIIKIFTQYKYSKNKNIDHLIWILNLKITGCRVDDKKYGWLFFFSQIENLTLLFRLDYFVEGLFKRYNIPTNTKKKKFIRAYNEIIKNRNNSSYIPNFDDYSVEDKLQILKNVFLINIEEPTKEKIEITFKRKIYQNIKELEKDIQFY